VDKTAKTVIEDGTLVRTAAIKVVMPPRAGPVKFTSDEQGPKVIFTLIDKPSADWVPQFVVGEDVLISQFSVERPKEGKDGPTFLVLRHWDAQQMAWWGNNLADFMRSRYDQLRYTPKR
tara:strand:+ start:156 stop:512 length:357 start_codon:yes stop_codon:yes gene_type:complete